MSSGLVNPLRFWQKCAIILGSHPLCANLRAAFHSAFQQQKPRDSALPPAPAALQAWTASHFSPHSHILPNYTGVASAILINAPSHSRLHLVVCMSAAPATSICVASQLDKASGYQPHSSAVPIAVPAQRANNLYGSANIVDSVSASADIMEPVGRPAMPSAASSLAPKPWVPSPHVSAAGSDAAVAMGPGANQRAGGPGQVINRPGLNLPPAMASGSAPSSVSPPFVMQGGYAIGFDPRMSNPVGPGPMSRAGMAGSTAGSPGSAALHSPPNMHMPPHVTAHMIGFPGARQLPSSMSPEPTGHMPQMQSTSAPVPGSATAASPGRHTLPGSPNWNPAQQAVWHRHTAAHYQNLAAQHLHAAYLLETGHNLAPGGMPMLSRPAPGGPPMGDLVPGFKRGRDAYKPSGKPPADDDVPAKMTRSEVARHAARQRWARHNAAKLAAAANTRDVEPADDEHWSNKGARGSQAQHAPSSFSTATSSGPFSAPRPHDL